MLTERQLLILKVIIDEFIKSANPVGSRAIAKKDQINYSAATIRNEMADLEEMGYLEKKHILHLEEFPLKKGIVTMWTILLLQL